MQEQEHSGEQSRLRGLSATDLLFQMPFLQTLLQRLLDCRPSGAAAHDAVVQVTLIDPVCLWVLHALDFEHQCHATAKARVAAEGSLSVVLLVCCTFTV